MELSFSKTRIVYWENEMNKLKKGDPATLSVSEFNKADANNSYAVVRLPGKLHNWSYIPCNKWGLYLTVNEMMSLYENFDIIKPIEISFVTGHTVPTAVFKTATGTATQLSFNNTIWSLIYELDDIDMVTNAWDFPNTTEALNFFKSFDGADYTSNHRVNLPVPDIFYKIPTTYDDSTKRLDNPGKFVLTQVGITATDTQANTFGQPLTTDQLKEIYCPEFLQDNLRVKALYPGENQDSYTYTNTNNPFSEIDLRANSFAEAWQERDRRNYGINSNLDISEAALLCTSVYPVCRGPIAGNGSDNSAGTNGEIFNNSAIDQNNIERLQRYAHNTSDKLFYAQGPNKKWIKGLPILDAGNNLVPHTFCGTVTWTLKLVGTPRTPIIPRPLKYGWCNAMTNNAVYKSGDTTTAVGTYQHYYAGWPKKPFHDHIMSDTFTPPRQRNAYWAKTTRPNIITSMVNTVPTTDTIDIDNTEEVDPCYFSKHPFVDVSTRAFEKYTPAPTTGRIAKKRINKKQKPTKSTAIDNIIQSVIDSSKEPTTDGASGSGD